MNKLSNRMAIAGISLAMCSVLMLLPASLQAQKKSVNVIGDSDDYARLLLKIPKSPVVKESATVQSAHFNFGLGAQFNTPVSLSSIFCDQAVARNEITKSISSILINHGYSLGTGWDKFGFLRTSRIGGDEIKLTSANREEIELDVKVDQTELGERAITFSYQVFTYLRANDQTTRQDRSDDKAVERYMEALRGEMRDAAETALKTACTRNTVGEITTKEDAIGKTVASLKLTHSQEEQLRSILGRANDN